MQQDYGIGTLGSGEAARFFAVDGAEPLECLAARFRRHAYAPHTHDTFVVGTIVEGCETFLIGGNRYYAGPGDLCLIAPGVVHDGEPAEESYAYRIAYPSIAYLEDTAEDDAFHTPRFAEPIVRDPALATEFAAAHHVAESGDALDRDERLLAVFARLLRRHGRARPKGNAPASEDGPVARALQYLDAQYADQVDLATLAAVAGIPRVRLLRAMKRATGMTPHAWLVDRRVRAARHLLGRGEAPAEVAQACGFCDQSHLNRVFKARIGVSPGAYQAALAR
jgi:AraC-like DNA-binding protein